MINIITSTEIVLRHYYHHIHPKDYSFPGHRHTNYEFNAIFDGEMQMTCDEHIFKLSKGDFIIQPPYSFHMNRVLGDTPAEILVVNFTVSNADFCATPFMGEMDGDTFKLLEIFSHDMEKYSVLSKAGRCVEIRRSAQKLFETYIDYISETPPKFTVLPGDKSRIYSIAVKYMNEHISDWLSIDDISKECKVCGTKLKSVFSQYTGKGCIEYFGEMKMEHAKRMLAEGKSCSEISEFLGFSSQSYFSKKFKQIIGITPSDFKNR